jgi:hypothetical protein
VLPGDDVATMAVALEAGCAALDTATAWATAPHDDPRALPAVATPYLELVGTVTGGWLMARAQLAAQAALAAGDDPAFHEAKLITARGYAEQVLGRADGLAREVAAGGTSVLALDEAAF